MTIRKKIVGVAIGRVTEKNRRIGRAPSIAAASMIELGTARKAAVRTM